METPKQKPKPKPLVLPGAEKGFLSSLSQDSINKLRRIVKAQHMSGWPSHLYTDYEADRIIEAIAPGVVEKLIRQGKGQGIIEKDIIV